MGNKMKGQYFSFDAIVAMGIFILAITLLMGHWFSIRQATDSTPRQLHEDALRVSDVLLSPGVPSSSWYQPYRLPTLTGVSKAGLSQSGQKGVFLDKATVNYVTSAPFAANPANYASLKSLLGVGPDLYALVFYQDGASLNTAYFGNSAPLVRDELVEQKAQVWRVIAINDSRGRPVPGGFVVVIYSAKK